MNQVLLDQMREFVNSLTSEDFANLGPSGEKTEYRRRTNRTKKQKKPGRPPKDYTAIEFKVDLERALEEGDFDSAIRDYYKLKGMLNR